MLLGSNVPSRCMEVLAGACTPLVINALFSHPCELCVLGDFVQYLVYL